jgi:hypothetical protein
MSENRPILKLNLKDIVTKQKQVVSRDALTRENFKLIEARKASLAQKKEEELKVIAQKIEAEKFAIEKEILITMKNKVKAAEELAKTTDEQTKKDAKPIKKKKKIKTPEQLAEEERKKELKKKNKEFLRTVKEIYRMLHEKYPEIINWECSKPLAVGIAKDIAKDLNIHKDYANSFCRYYCGRVYMQNIVEGADRYNLQGEIKGKVTKAHFIHTKKKLEKRMTVIQQTKAVTTEQVSENQ